MNVSFLYIKPAKQQNEGKKLTAREGEHWKILHTYPVENAQDWDAAKAKVFFINWQRSIPNTKGCPCKAKWKKLGLIPDYSSPQAFFEWTVFAHNSVSERLEVSKPTITNEQAYAIWWPA